MLVSACRTVLIKRQIFDIYKINHKQISMGEVFSLLRKPKETDMSAQKEFVREAIAKNNVVIFSKSYCPYCHMAKEVFGNLNVDACVIELDERSDGDAIQNVLGEMTGARTVPRCFINGKFVGGGNDVKQMYESGELQTYFN